MQNESPQNALIEPEVPEGFQLSAKGEKIRIYEEITPPENAEVLSFHIRFAQPENQP
jgi:hypothetical protein